MLSGELYEPRDNWWNTRVSHAPVDPNSAAIIALIASYESSGGRLHPDFAPDFGIPYCVVDENTPLVPVAFSNTGESDRGYPGGPVGYPIPRQPPPIFVTSRMKGAATETVTCSFSTRASAPRSSW